MFKFRVHFKHVNFDVNFDIQRIMLNGQLLMRVTFREGIDYKLKNNFFF